MSTLQQGTGRDQDARRGTGRGRRRARAAAAVLSLAGALVLTGCSGRSPEAFCSELKTSMDGINAKYKATSNDALAGLGGLMENLGEFTRMLHKLDELAPDEIKSEMAESVKAWDRQADTAQEMVKNPLGALAGGLASGIMSAGSMKAVDAWAKTNCQMPVFGFADAGESLAQRVGAGTSGTTAGPSSGSGETAVTPEPSPATEEIVLGPGMVKSPGRGTSSVTFLRRGGVIALDADGGLGELGSGDGRKVGVVDEKTYEVLTVLPLVDGCDWSRG